MPAPQRSPSASACGAYREVIELGVARDRNAVGIWQDLVGDYGFTSGYQSVKRFLCKLRGSQSPEAGAVIVTAPGEEAEWITAAAPWCGTRTAASTGARGCS
jgi:hypothetical protein